jgi:hypothetical protein
MVGICSRSDFQVANKTRIKKIKNYIYIYGRVSPARRREDLLPGRHLLGKVKAISGKGKIQGRKERQQALKKALRCSREKRVHLC